MFLSLCYFGQNVYIPVCMSCKYTKITYSKLQYHCKKKASDFPVPQPGCHLPNSPLPGIQYLIIPGQGEFGTWQGTGKSITFLQCINMLFNLLFTESYQNIFLNDLADGAVTFSWKLLYKLLVFVEKICSAELPRRIFLSWLSCYRDGRRARCVQYVYKLGYTGKKNENFPHK